jgi:hypothetical protein
MLETMRACSQLLDADSVVGLKPPTRRTEKERRPQQQQEAAVPSNLPNVRFFAAFTLEANASCECSLRGGNERTDGGGGTFTQLKILGRSLLCNTLKTAVVPTTRMTHVEQRPRARDTEIKQDSAFSYKLTLGTWHCSSL